MSMEDFRALYVCFKSEGSQVSSTHTIYCKLHQLRDNSKHTPNKKTLFTLGWPPYCTGDLIKELFSRAGDVTSVFLQSSPGPVKPPVDEQPLPQSIKGFQVAYIVMSSQSDATAALGLCNSSSPIPCSLSGSIGLTRWCSDYKATRPSVTQLESSTETCLASYDRRQEAARMDRKRAGKPDDDGWITVTRKSRRIQSTSEESGRKKHKKKKAPLNLYHWQQRETQRQQVAELRRKFEEDKERVAKMKTMRKFKPFS